MKVFVVIIFSFILMVSCSREDKGERPDREERIGSHYEMKLIHGNHLNDEYVEATAKFDIYEDGQNYLKRSYQLGQNLNDDYALFDGRMMDENYNLNGQYVYAGQIHELNETTLSSSHSFTFYDGNGKSYSNNISMRPNFLVTIKGGRIHNLNEELIVDVNLTSDLTYDSSIEVLIYDEMGNKIHTLNQNKNGDRFQDRFVFLVPPHQVRLIGTGRSQIRVCRFQPVSVHAPVKSSSSLWVSKCTSLIAVDFF